MVTPGVYIVRSFDNFFLVTLEEKEKAYIIKCLPTASKHDHSTFDDDAFPTSCVDAIVPKGTPGVSASDFKLHTLRFDSSCSLGGGLEHGDGSEELLLCTLGFCYKIFKVDGPAWFSFLDMSEIECEGSTISLRDYDLLVKGETWYQRRFGATVDTKESQDRIDAYSKVLKKTTFSQEDADNLMEVLRWTDEMTLTNKYKYSRILKGVVGKSWSHMISRINGDEERTGCSFFCDDVVNSIMLALGLGYVVRFEIEMNRKRADSWVKGFKMIHSCS